MKETVSHEDGFTYVKYREDKRPLKLAPYIIDDHERGVYLARIVRFIEAAANKPEHIKKMEPTKFWQLVERLSTLACREFSPTTNWGVTKPEIRGAVYFVLLAGINAGQWPDEYPVNDGTFVQYGGERDV